MFQTPLSYSDFRPLHFQIKLKAEQSVIVPQAVHEAAFEVPTGAEVLQWDQNSCRSIKMMLWNQGLKTKNQSSGQHNKVIWV